MRVHRVLDSYRVLDPHRILGPHRVLPSKYLSWWRRLNDVFLLYLRRRLRDILINMNFLCLALMSSEDVFKTSWSRPIHSFWSNSSKALQDVFNTTSRRLSKTSSRLLHDLFKTPWKNVLKTSSRHLRDVLTGMKIYRFCPATTKMNMGKDSVAISYPLPFNMLFWGCNPRTGLNTPKERDASRVES